MHDKSKSSKKLAHHAQKKINISSFGVWSPKAYLKDYYTYVEPDEIATIEFLVRKFKYIKKKPRILEFGCGPTLHHIFAATPVVSEIHMADYLSSNLEEIKYWIDKKQNAHSWKPFIRYALQCENRSTPTEKQIHEREQSTRKKITALLSSDASKANPLGKLYGGTYPLVMSCYCADSATSDKKTWFRYMHNIASLVSNGGTFITTALKDALCYKVGDKYFPSAQITEGDMVKALALDFLPESISIEVRDIPEHADQGYTGIILATASKRP